MHPTARKVLAAAALLLGARTVVRLLGFLRWRRQICAQYPGYSPSLLLGDLPKLLEVGGYNEEFFTALHNKFGKFARLFLSPTMLNMSTIDPELAHEAHTKMSSRPHETWMFLSYLTKDNLLFSHGPMVKALRLRYGKMISNVDQLRKLNDVSFEQFSPLIANWRDASARGETVTAHADLAPVIYKIMGKVFFGSQFTDTDVGQRIYDLHMHLIANTATYMFWPDSFKPWFLPGYRKYDAVLREWHDTCWQLIEDHRAKVAADPAQFADDEGALTMLCTSKDEHGELFFNRGRAVATMCGLLNGGFDTTHCTLYWLIFHLARFPEAQERLRSAIRRDLGGRRTCTVEEGRGIEELDCFFRESLRFCSTVTVNQRVNYDEDVRIGAWTVPKGVNVNTPLSQLMRDPRHFGNDAELFRPERFMASDPGSGAAKKAWLAFGAHTRMCVGYTFAQVELKAFLVALLQTTRVTFGSNAVSPEELARRVFEAGVNQPKTKAAFAFEPLGAHGGEASLAEWWTPPKDKKSRASTPASS